MRIQFLLMLVTFLLMCGCGEPKGSAEGEAALEGHGHQRETSGTKREPVAFGNKVAFLLGVNYPWLNYGHDFGTTAWGHDGISCQESVNEVNADFAYLKSQDVHVVRWFVFADCRAAPEFDDTGMVTGFDEHFFRDMDAAVAAARNHEVYIMPVLLDFHLCDEAKIVSRVKLGGRSRIISDRKVQESFIKNALKPLLQRYRQNQQIIAWDVINEPEGAMDIDGGRWVPNTVSVSAMQDFVKEVVDCIHTNSSQHVTLGSVSRSQLKLWIDSGLDFYQFHYYDKMGKENSLDYPYARLQLDKPCIVGEFPTKKTPRTTQEFLNLIKNNGYGGALAWSFRAGDEYSDFKANADDVLRWSKNHGASLKKQRDQGKK